MIDIHCHILPGIDDGAKDLTESFQMARQAAKEGIRTIIATPHHKNGQYINMREDILKQVDMLNEQLKERGIDLVILPGQESRIYGEMIEDYEQREILTLADTAYVFVEFPSNHVPAYADQLFFDLQMKGLMPIIVHPERNSELVEQPDKLYKFVKNGVATQVTAASVTGDFGKKIQKFTFDLIESNLTHFIASDAHNTTTRNFRMKAAFDLVQQRYGNDSMFYFMDNAELLVDGLNIDKDVPARIKKKKLFGLF